MRCIRLVFLASLVPATAVASPARPLVSVDIGPALALDGRLGVGGDARGAVELPVSGRVSLGLGLEVGAAAWSDVGEMDSGDVVGANVFGKIHVAVQLTPTLRLEPAVGGGMIHERGDTIRGTLPAYSSTVALVRDTLRVGVSSHVCIGELESFTPGTQLSLFVGWQS
ncbi:MAG: hypothetical protein HOV81_22230 [Kofleriaceae bacterium]|nr:hypothetical protein [Kofleriaceae bacterium]